jgi:hypothetical protein
LTLVKASAFVGATAVVAAAAATVATDADAEFDVGPVIPAIASIADLMAKLVGADALNPGGKALRQTGHDGVDQKWLLANIF